MTNTSQAAAPLSTNAGTWATTASADPATTLSTVQDGLPIRLIATARSAFKTCGPDEELARVVERNPDGFDHFPVVECGGATQGRIVGLLNIAPFMHDANPSGLVRCQMDPLSEDNLIGADASLLTFIRSADSQGCRLVFSGPKISGLVSLSDLQRLPVRASLFAMVTHLEITMADAIRREFPHGEGWLARLSDARQKKICCESAKSRSHDAFVETLLFTQFADKRDIIRKSNRFEWSTTVFDSELKQIGNLRDDVAHANNYASTREAACCVCESVRLMDVWIERLSGWGVSADSAL